MKPCANYKLVIFYLIMLMPFVAVPPEAHADEGSVFALPEDPNQVDFYLLTSYRGFDIASTWGHSIVRVVDHNNRRDLNFNWGIYDFNDPNFVLNFYQGNPVYKLIVTGFDSVVKQYRYIEKRSLIQEKLNLTNAQKMALFARLVEDLRPENRKYVYNQFYDNCSTRIRDHLNAVLHDQIKQRFGSALSGMTHRMHIRDHTNGALWWAYIGLDILLNGIVDQPLSKWDEMFLPKSMREHFSMLPAFDDAGMPIPRTNLLSETTVLFEFPEPIRQSSPYFLLGLFWLIPLVLILFLWWNAYKSCAVRMFGVMLLLWGLFAGVFGILMVSNSLSTNYEIAQWSANLWLLWPIDLFFVCAGCLTLRHGHSYWHSQRRSLKLTRLLIQGHLVGIVCYVILSMTSIIAQSSAAVIATLGTSAALMWVTAIGLAHSATEKEERTN